MDLCRYRACFDDPADGVLVMTHEAKGCEATVEIPASALRSLYRGPSYSTHNRGNPTCMRKCMNPTDFSRCDNHCAMQWVREVIQLMRQHSMSEVA